MAPIRILHLARVINRYDFIDTVVRHLPREHFSVEVATFQPESNIEAPNYAAVGIPHHVITVADMRSYGGYVRAAWRLTKFLRQRRIQILHTHHFWEGVIGALTHRMYPRFKFVLHRHYTEDIVRVGGWKKHLLLRLERLSYRHADRLLLPTQTMRAYVESLYESGRLPRMEVIPYGFEFEAHKYHPLSQEEYAAIRAQAGVGENEIVIANVGSHRRQKGQVELIAAFGRLVERVPHARLWLIGSGPETDILREQAAPLRDRVCFWGWKQGAEVRSLMGAADIIAHPTYSEAFPQVMVEALALERALVITQVSGVREVLRHGEDAWIIPPENVDALYEALFILCENAELRKRLGRQGRQRVLSQLHYKVINPHYEKLYTTLCFP